MLSGTSRESDAAGLIGEVGSRLDSMSRASSDSTSARNSPVGVDGPFGDAELGCGLTDAQAGEETKLDDLGLSGAQSLELFERLVIQPVAFVDPVGEIISDVRSQHSQA